MIEVVNLRTCSDWGLPGDIRIDRRTKWGNPFKITPTLSRSESIRKYKEYFFESGLAGEFEDEVKDARRLGCWCAPLACHGDVIKRFVESGEVHRALVEEVHRALVEEYELKPLLIENWSNLHREGLI